MKRPIEPQKPNFYHTKPEPPSEFEEKRIDIYIDDCLGSNLKFDEFCTKLQKDLPTSEQIFVDISSTYSGIVFDFFYIKKIKKSKKRYENELKEYLKELDTYNKKLQYFNQEMNEYNIKYNKYLEDSLMYKEFMKKKEIESLEKRLKELKNK